MTMITPTTPISREFDVIHVFAFQTSRQNMRIEESIPNLANTIAAKEGKAGLQYLDYLGRTVPW
jgi:hypothetical protein